LRGTDDTTTFTDAQKPQHNSLADAGDAARALQLLNQALKVVKGLVTRQRL
jgi:hypothetical protein